MGSVKSQYDNLKMEIIFLCLYKKNKSMHAETEGS